jgi:NAD(P)-dependent dehydrogenase (short-subunit alcohol dehydrogenase family)
MQEWLRNPASLFDIEGQVAIVTGASGAFGALASKVLAGAGARVVLAAGNTKALEEVAADCRALGAEVVTVVRRPQTEADCDAIADAALQAFGAGAGDVAGAVSGGDGRERDRFVADGAGGGRADDRAGHRRPRGADVFGARQVGTSGGV